MENKDNKVKLNNVVYLDDYRDGVEFDKLFANFMNEEDEDEIEPEIDTGSYGTLIIMANGDKGNIELLNEFLKEDKESLNLMDIPENFDSSYLNDTESFTFTSESMTKSMSTKLIPEIDSFSYCMRLSRKFIDLNLNAEYYYKSQLGDNKSVGYGKVENGSVVKIDWI